MSAPVAETMTGREALTAALAAELERSGDVVLMGETVRGVGAAGVAAGLYERFGASRIIETPVSENGFFAAALGLALAGVTAVVEIYSADFLLAVANEVINDMAKWRWQQGRDGALPIVIRGCMGANGGLGSEHSQCMESYLHHAPGLKLVCPGTPADAAGLLRSAIRDGGPVVVLEHRKVYELEAGVPADPDHAVPFGVAEVAREGTDVTIVAWAWMRTEALRAAEELERQGISAEVLDPRTIRPLDWDAILGSATRTGRLLVAEEAPLTGSVGAEIVARVAETTGGLVRCARVAMPDVIHPYRADMESIILPTAADVIRGARALVDGEAAR